MKITGVDVYAASYAIGDVPPRRRSFGVLKLSTDEGLVGWGEASDCYGHTHPLTLKALIEEEFRWLLLDQDPTPVEQLTGRIRTKIYHYLGSRELPIQALSAIEIALWDIRGKALGRSISDLLGRYRDRLELYAAGKPQFNIGPEEHLAFFQHLLDRGVKTAKIRIGNNLAWDERFIREMRRILPGDVQLLCDGKYNYRPDSAIRIARVLGEVGALYFEEPISDQNLDLVARVAAESPVPLAYGEHSFGLHDFRELIVRKAARVLTPDATICGGIGEARNVAMLADTFGLEVTPHCGGLTAIGFAANFHVAASIPNFHLFEFDARAVQPLRDELPTEPLFSVDRIVDGCLPVPTGPGLGVEVDESVFGRYPYEIDPRIARAFPVYATPHV